MLDCTAYAHKSQDFYYSLEKRGKFTLIKTNSRSNLSRAIKIDRKTFVVCVLI